MKLSRWEMDERKNLPLDIKINMSKERIKEWYKHYNGQVYVSFSGGKDSVVLLHLVRSIYPEVPGVFFNTGQEFPEILQFIRTCDNIVKIKPKMTFKQIIEKYGFPVVSKDVSQKIYEIRTTNSDKLKQKRLHGDEKGNGKIREKWKFLVDCPFKISHKCCHVLKKYPACKYEKETQRKPFIGSLAEESTLRSTNYRKYGCNDFSTNRPKSQPMSFWREHDVWDYIHLNNIPYSKIYDMGYTRTGCIFCMFGIHLEHPNKFELMKITHPKLYDYCMNKLGLKEILQYVAAEGKKQPKLF